MENIDLYRMLEFENEVTERLIDYENSRDIQLSEALIKKLLVRKNWEEGINELKELLGEDENGIKILWELLNIVREYTYKEYQKKNISDEIFIETMKFCTRCLREHYDNFGSYRFIMAWWFPRELAFEEFRVGALEYEFAQTDMREIYIHIPSDADLSRESVQESLKMFYEFRRNYFPEWEEVLLVCDSWLLSPALKDLLDETSNILAFQELFEIDETNPEATWFMSFVYPGYGEISEELPEKTTLQRRMKTYLLKGKQVGVAKGHLK